MATLFDAANLLATTCAGPSTSTDGGATWRSPANLGWPLATGAPLLAVRLRPRYRAWQLLAGLCLCHGRERREHRPSSTGPATMRPRARWVSGRTSRRMAWPRLSPYMSRMPRPMPATSRRSTWQTRPPSGCQSTTAPPGRAVMPGFDGARVQDAHGYQRASYPGNFLRGIFAAAEEEQPGCSSARQSVITNCR